MFNFEGSPDIVVRVGVHAEGEGGSVAFRAIIVVGRQDFDDLPRRTVFRQDRAVVLQEPRRVVVDVLHDDGQSGGRGFGWIAVVDSQDLDLVRRRCFSVELALDGNGSVFRDRKLSAPIRASIDEVSNLAMTSLIRIRSSKSFQSFSDPRVFADEGLNVGLFKDGSVVVDVSKLDYDPRVGHVILVVVIVLALVVHLNPESETLPLQLIFIIQRLDNLEGSCSVVVPDHGELVGAES